jgi:hypothetical protein
LENYTQYNFALAAASDKVYQLLALGRWFSPGTPASSTTKTGRHDIAEILLKVALNTKKKSKKKKHKKTHTFKGILFTSCVIFSYPKLLSISVLTFIK